jgi:hypothetical protein
MLAVEIEGITLGFYAFFGGVLAIKPPFAVNR